MPALLGRRRRPARRSSALDPLTGRRLPEACATIGVLVYRGVTTNEVDTPVARLADRLGADVQLVASAPGPLPGVEPARTVVADSGPDPDLRPDVLVVPGGLGWRRVAGDAELAGWLGAAAASARGVLAMSTGTLLLASVGALDGRDATGHWLAATDLARMGAVVHTSRTARAEAGRLVTAAGALAAMRVVDDLADHVAWSPQRLT